MPVTMEEVSAAYQYFFGRKAEDREITQWLHLASVDELRKRFLVSPEFHEQFRRYGGMPTTKIARHPQDVPSLSVEWDAREAELSRLVDHVAQTWTTIGNDEPHWSVLSSDEFKVVHLEHNAAKFYASGANNCRLVSRTLQRQKLRPTDLHHAIEYGCGVGRVTPHLAAMFPKVTGIDISESHLSHALEAVKKSGLKNVELVQARIPDFGMYQPCDFWYSYIVLQHNPPPIIALILKKMFSILTVGGVAIFQVPTYVPGYSFNVSRYLAVDKLGAIEVHLLPQRVVFQLAADAGCVPLEVLEDSAMSFPWVSNTFVFQKLDRPVL